ncbi:uncharacterized protein [Rhodnius prolixus]
MFQLYLSLSLLFALTFANSSSESMWRVTTKIWQECNRINEDVASCLQTKLISTIDRAVRTDYLPLWDSVAIVSNTNASRSDFGRAISEDDLAKAKKQGKLTDILWDRMANFISSRTVKIDLPKLSAEELKSGVEEGRGKMKKMMSMMMMGGAMKAMMVIPLALGLLFLLAGKALIVAKVALVLSLLITLKKLLSAKQDDHGGWQSSGGHGGWDRRTLDAHNIVYSAYRQ